MTPRWFTREEAEALVPRLTDLLRQLQERKREYDRHEAKVADLTLKMRGNGHGLQDDLREAQGALERAAEGVNALAEQVHELGCELKGIEEGLIDFRSEIAGREVYLCWKLGENAIEWWHDLETGFAGRQPLEAQ
jgi:hypothetical protein